MHMVLKAVAIVVFLLIPSLVFAKSCSDGTTKILAKLVEEGALVFSGNEMKLFKFTAHEYPVWCDTEIQGVRYKIFTGDLVQNRFIVQEEPFGGMKYYGLFSYGI